MCHYFVFVPFRWPRCSVGCHPCGPVFPCREISQVSALRHEARVKYHEIRKVAMRADFKTTPVTILVVTPHPHHIGSLRES